MSLFTGYNNLLTSLCFQEVNLKESTCLNSEQRVRTGEGSEALAFYKVVEEDL